MTDERAALIERLAKTCEERYPYRNGETYHEDWRPTDDTVRPVTYGVLRAINAEIARLSEEARYERARADKAVLQLEGTRAEFRDFDDTREAMARDYCALVEAIGVDMDAPPAVLDDVRRHGLSLSALNAAREEARALREAMEEIEAFIVIDHNIDPYQAIAVFAKRCARAALARAKGETE